MLVIAAPHMFAPSALAVRPLLAEIPPGLALAITFGIAAALGMAVVKLLDYLRKRDADKEAAQIIERAEIEAQTRR
ncbi:MAG TPA: hypothetical protein VEQ85_09260, partial [Lacipirellulaceae bacterium]|nr:hypothetical protein [Lacipirellulaceae bacterium]